MNVWIYHDEGEEDGSIVSHAIFYFDASKLTEDQKKSLLMGDFVYWQDREAYRNSILTKKDVMNQPIHIEKTIKPYSDLIKMYEKNYELVGTINSNNYMK